MTLRVNGVVVTDSNPTGTSIYMSTVGGSGEHEFVIGREDDTDGSYFEGKIDDMRIYNYKKLTGDAMLMIDFDDRSQDIQDLSIYGHSPAADGFSTDDSTSDYGSGGWNYADLYNPGLDTDFDTITNDLDDDIDGDGIPNWVEYKDTDGDGIPDYLDSDADPSDDDTDTDSTLDINDPDIDGDSITDLSTTPPDEDTNKDSDIKNDDDDHDGIPNCYDTDGTPGDGNDDLDGDSILDAVDSDIDGDGIPNDEEWGDMDYDGIPDFADAVTTVYSSEKQKFGTGAGEFVSTDSDYIKFSDSSSLESTDITVEVWVKPDSDCDGYVVYKGSDYSLKVYEKNPTDEFLTAVGSVNVGSVQTVEGRLPSLDTTHKEAYTHIAMVVKDSEYIRIYINGILIEENEISTGITYSSSDLYIGSSSPSADLYDGLIDNVIISDYAKTFREDPDGDSISDIYEIIRSSTSDQYDPIEYNGRYAFLFTGSNYEYNSPAFWNDQKIMYDVLKSYGYNDLDIHMMYDDDYTTASTPDDYRGDHDDPNEDSVAEAYGNPTGVQYTDYCPTFLDLDTAINRIAQMSSNRDFIYNNIIAHGTLEGTDEFYVDLGNSGELWDYELAGQMRQFSFKYQAIIFSACESGSIIPEFSHKKTTICTSTDNSNPQPMKNVGSLDDTGIDANEDGINDGVGQGFRHWEFPYHIMSAFRGYLPVTSCIDVDMEPTGVDSNDVISITEAFDHQFANNYYSAISIPQIDDNGNMKSQQSFQNNCPYCFDEDGLYMSYNTVPPLWRPGPPTAAPYTRCPAPYYCQQNAQPFDTINPSLRDTTDGTHIADITFL